MRADAVALVSILVTLAADGIALLRYLPVRTGAPAGWALAFMVVILIALALLESGWV